MSILAPAINVLGTVTGGLIGQKKQQPSYTNWQTDWMRRLYDEINSGKWDWLMDAMESAYSPARQNIMNMQNIPGGSKAGLLMKLGAQQGRATSQAVGQHRMNLMQMLNQQIGNPSGGVSGGGTDWGGLVSGMGSDISQQMLFSDYLKKQKQGQGRLPYIPNFAKRNQFSYDPNEPWGAF